MIGQDPEMLQMFLEESNEHISNLEPNLLKLEEMMDNPDNELINEIFRAVHSLKGSAGFFGFKNISDLSHSMENLLSLVRDGKKKPFPKMITVLLKGTDKLAQMIADIDNSETIDIADDLEELKKIISDDYSVNTTIRLEMEGQEDLPQKIAKEFDIALSTLKNSLSHGHFLYAVRAYTHKDMKEKNKTPLDFLREISKLGSLIGSYSDISAIGSFSDIRKNEIAFVFLFSSVLEPDLISLGLEVDESQIQELKIPHKKSETEKTEEISSDDPAEVLPDESDDSSVVTEVYEAVEDTTVVEDKPEEEKTEEDRPQETKTTTTKKSVGKETLRVNVALLNDLMSLAGELVLARNQLLRMASDVAGTVPGLQNVLQDIDMTTTLLQGKIMDTRMQPIAIVFNKYPRVIRDLQSRLKKKIRLEITGKDVDLDKSIIEMLSDPLTHLVRNSADHGIELPEERRKSGKQEEGTILLKAYHEGGKVNIDIVDDGAGINPDKILAKAIENGIVTKHASEKMTRKEILNLIFAPGFSTAEQVSSVSGRGVGMDVVRTNIEKLGGSVSLDSQLGKGTTINLKLPLTLAIIPSLIVTVNEMNFAVPQVALREIVRVRKQQDANEKSNLCIEKVNESPVLRLRNKLLPIVFLDDVLGLSTEQKDAATHIKILVLQHDDNEFGLVVDEIFDSEEIVVKSIPRFFKESKAYAGTTIMGDGTVALILDVGGIASKAALSFEGLAEHKTETQAKASDETDEKQNLLIFENAKDEYFALNLDLVKRVEGVKVADIDKIGEKHYIEHEGKSLRIINLEHYLPVKSAETTGDEVFVIIPNKVEDPIGIISHKIIDSIETNVDIDTDSVVAKGLIGTSILDGRIVIFPDIYELIEMSDPEIANRHKENKNSKYNILTVDDTPFFRTIVKQYLNSAGFNVDTAFDGKNALKKATQKQYDMFVVDLIMPNMDGFEFVQAVRNDPVLKDIPAIALTTLTNDESRQKAIKSGFDAFEVKIHKNELLNKVKFFLEKGRITKN